MTPFEAAGVLLACLESAYTGDAGVPGEFCQRPGDQVAFLLTPTVDDCCNGLGWVRIQAEAPVIDPEQSNEITFNPCNHSDRMVTLELGVARCNPSGTPTCAQWTELAARMDLDRAAMRRAVCCATGVLTGDLSTSVYRVLGGTWEPLESSGNCAGGSMTVVVWIACTDCED